MTFTRENSILLLVDLQERLMPAIADGERVVANAIRLARAAAFMDIPVLATEQNPAGLGPNVPEVKALALRTLGKQFFDATRETTWANFFPEDRRDVVVAGCEAHVCVLQTVLGLRRQGLSVRLVRDAIGSRTPENRAGAADRARSAGAEIVTTEMVIFEWLETAEHPRFRDVLKLVK
jgi:nicotinamidase-related amidase